MSCFLNFLDIGFAVIHACVSASSCSLRLMYAGIRDQWLQFDLLKQSLVFLSIGLAYYGTDFTLGCLT